MNAKPDEPNPPTEPGNPVQAYFRRTVRILGFARPAWHWMLGSFAVTSLLAALAVVFFNTSHRFFFPPAMGWALGSLLAASFLGLFLVMLRALFTSRSQFTIFTLLLSAIAFTTNSEALDHAVFPPFTLRTTVALWICFAALALSNLRERLPVLVRHALLPVLSFGAMLCIAFVIVLSPFMAFSWALVWAGGLGFLPYSPLFALIGFILAAHTIYTTIPQTGPHTRAARGTILLTIAITLAYSAYYKLEWDRAETVLRRPVIEAGHNRIDADLPGWLQKASRLPVNHVSEMLLQPNRDSSISLFGVQSLFDPLAFLASVTSAASPGLFNGSRSSEEPVSAEDQGHMLHLLFGHPSAHLDRLWRGDSLITTDINSHVQLHPELRVAYTETTISILNERSSSQSNNWFGIRSAGLSRPEEAIYTIRLPEGSVCTKLSLWIDGEERPARLTFRSNAKRAYQTIVGRERRDPAYVEWLDGNRLRLRVFPVPAQQYRTVRIGIISPLREEGSRLHYERIALEGPDDEARQDVRVDVFSTSNVDLDTRGIWLSEEVVPDGQVRQFTGRLARSTWSLSIPATRIAGTISAGEKSYELQPMQKEKRSFVPSAIVVSLNGALSRAEWKDLVARLYDFHIPVYMLTGEWFHTTERSKALAYLDSCDMPAFNLPPLAFPVDHHLGGVLWVVAGEEQSIPLGELRGSSRFTNTMAMAPVTPDPVVIVHGRPSAYIESLIDLHRLIPVATGEEGLMRVLRERAIEIPQETTAITPLPSAGLQLRRVNAAPGLPGSDLLVRLALHRRLMKTLGQRFFDRDLDNKDLLQVARDGMMVSPVSTLIVLETERDYQRFGIGTDTSLLGQSKLEAPGGVPEPHEVALALSLAIGLAIFFRTRTRLARVD